MFLTPLDRRAVIEIVGAALSIMFMSWVLIGVFGVADGLLFYVCLFVILMANGLWLSRAFDRLKARSSARRANTSKG